MTSLRSVVVLLLVTFGIAIALLTVSGATGTQEVHVTDTQFEDVTVGDSMGAPLRLSIQNPTAGAEATFEQFELRGPDADEFEVVGLDTPVTIRGAEIHRFAVVLEPTSPGPKSAELVVTGTANENRFNLQGRAYPADSFEPNDEIDAAAAITAGEPIEAATVGEDFDFYSFDPAVGQTANVTVENRGQHAIAYLVSVRGVGVLQGPTEIPANESRTFAFDVTADAQHLVAVTNVFTSITIETGQQYNVTVPYEMSVTTAGDSGTTPGETTSTPTQAEPTTQQPESPTPGNGTTADGDGPGFGIVSALAGFGCLAYLLRRSVQEGN